MSKNQALVTSSKKKVVTSSQEWTYKSMNQDKTSGNYQQVTARKNLFSGDIVRGGQPAHGSEYKVAKTVRTGSDGGYVEYHKEERITKVDYNKSSNYKYAVCPETCGHDNSKGYGSSSYKKGCSHCGYNKGYKGYGGS